MRRITAVAGLLLSVTLMSGGPLVAQGERQKAAKSGKRETLTAEQKEKLKENIRQGAERRKAERPQLVARLKASNEQFRALERQKITSENAALRARAGAFKSQAGDARYEAIEREARELTRRASKASDDERKAIDRRAAELLAELRGRKPQR